MGVGRWAALKVDVNLIIWYIAYKNFSQDHTAFDHEVRKVLVLLVHISAFDDVGLHVEACWSRTWGK